MLFSQLLAAIAAPCPGSHLDPDLSGVATLEEASSHDLAFLENVRFFSQIRTTQAGALILPQDNSVVKIAQERGIAYVAVPQPRWLFAQAIRSFHPEPLPTPHIHPSAVIAPTAHLGQNIFIGAHSVIGDRVILGDDVQIYPNVTLYNDVTIGDRSLLHANIVIHPQTTIGADCVIHSGVVIGGEGFGFVPNQDGTWTKMPQVGRVILEDAVEVGCNSAIDRGALGITRIGKGTKIDNLVQVGHGCQIGEHSLLAGQVGLAGGVRLGKHVVLAGQVGVSNHLTIGDRAVIGAKSGVAANVPSGAKQMGHPSCDSHMFFKVTVLLRRLPEIYKIVKQLQERL